MLMLNFLALCEALVLRDGVYVLEHPADPNEDPFPSVFATSQLLQFEERVGGGRGYLEQCALGGVTRKPTGLSTCIKSLQGCGPLCPGVSATHKHEPMGPKVVAGKFRSQRRTRAA